MQTKYLRSAIVLVLLVCAGSGYAEQSQVIINDGDKVAFLGDSITAGGANYGGYCRLVVHGLKTKNVTIEPVLAGVSGNTSQHMLQRLEQSVLRHKPDWVVLAAGVNDIWHGDPTVKIGVFQSKPGMGANLNDYQKNVTAIVDRCAGAGTRVILTTITPIREDPQFKLNITARQYNAFLHQLAMERKLPIAKLNEEMFAQIAEGTRLTSDGVHPTDVGHRAMAKGILRAIGLSEEDILRCWLRRAWRFRRGSRYWTELNRNCVTLAEALKLGGYRTYMAGKWHVCKDFAADGPKHNWPLQRGFDRFFGTLIAAGSQWNPMTLTEGDELVEPQGDFFYTEAISRKAVEYIGSHEVDDPFFLYVAHTAPHWPLHARASVIEKYRGRFAEGWDVLRRRRLDRLVQAGILSEDLVLSDRGEGIPPWKDAPHKQWEQSRMEAYAAMVDHVDQGVGDVVQALKRKGLLENTLIFFLSDNGGDSLEHPNGRIGSTGKPWAYMRYVPLYTREGRPVIAGDYPGLSLGPDQTYGGYGTKWANLSNAPFRYFKKYAHEGGVATPLIVHWPAGIKVCGEIRHQPAHVIDLMATSLEVAGISYPDQYGNQPIEPLDGKSLLPVFARDTAIHETLFFEHHGNRAVRKGKWKLVAIQEGPWALYDIARDRTETTDLADQHPAVIGELATLYEAWAKRSNVLPVDALKIEEIPGAENPLTRDPLEMNRFLKTVNQELRRRDLPLFDVTE